MNLKITKLSDREWNEISIPVELCLLPLDYREFESRLKLTFDIETGDMGREAYLYLKINDFKVLVVCPVTGDPNVDKCLVSVFSFELDWGGVIQVFSELFDLNRSELPWVQNELVPKKWKVEFNQGEEVKEYYFPDELRLNAAIKTLRKQENIRDLKGHKL